MTYHHPLKLRLLYNYADDTILYNVIYSTSDCLSLQNDLNTLLQWGIQSDMCFSPAKSVYMRITRKHNPIVYNYSINSTPIEEVQATKYLGLTITKDLSWSTHITSKALSVKGFLQRNLKPCPILKCYNTMIRPILEYASPVWSPHTRRDIEKLEQVQRQSARFIIGDFSRFSSVTSMLNDLNIPSLEHRRQLSNIILLYKVIHNLIDISSTDLLPITSTTRGHNQRFHHLFASIATPFFQDLSDYGTQFHPT